MAKLGRPKLDSIDLERVRQLAAQGLTREQIAHNLGIGRTTLFEKKKTDPNFSDAIKKGEAEGIAAVSNALYQAAIAGNVTAMIFFLKCRDRQQWGEQQVSATAPCDAQNQPTEPIDHATMTRMAKAFLLSRGVKEL